MRKTICFLSAALLPALFYSGFSPASTLRLKYSTYLGGSTDERGHSLAVDSEGCAYVTGRTDSPDFPTLDPYQASAGNNDVFVSKFTSSGTGLLYSTYLGGGCDDRGLGICVDSLLRSHVTGFTDSTDFPNQNPYQSFVNGDEDAFVSCLTSSGTDLVYSTYLGGALQDNAESIAIDTSGYPYVTGWTQSTDFPVWNAFEPDHSAFGFVDPFVTKLASTGNFLIYSTFLGGSSNDYAYAICVDTADRAYVTGYTNSFDFPTVNAFQAGQASGFDIFVTRLRSGGGVLDFSTYLGGGGADYGRGIAADTFCRAYVSGYSNSDDFPTENPYQASRRGDYDVITAKFSASGDALIYSTYLGSSDKDYCYGMDIDSSDRAHLVGYYTLGDDFPVVNPYQVSPAGSYDSFVTRLGVSGSSLDYSTYLGGTSADYGYGICVDSAGLAYLTGYSYSTDFPVKNSYRSSLSGSTDSFVARFKLETPTPPPTAPPTPSATPTPTPSVHVPTPTPAPSATPEPAATPTATPSVTPQPSVTPSPPPTVTPTPGGYHLPWFYDYDGDGTSDITVFRETSGLWAIRGVSRIYFGSSSDRLVPGDYNGDGTTDPAVFRDSSGLWAVRGLTRIYFGASSDLPVPGDYGGEGTASAGIFRETSGLWAIRDVTRVYFGSSSDELAPGYFDGEGRKNIGIYRPVSGLWAIRGLTRVYFGSPGDELVPGDYDGSGAWAFGIYRSTSGLWAVRGVTRLYFGASSDRPVPADFTGSGRDDLAVFRNSSGLWAVRGLTRIYYGRTGDLPVTR